MKRLSLLSVFLSPLLFPGMGLTAQNLAPLEAVAAGYAAIQPALSTYRVTDHPQSGWLEDSP